MTDAPERELARALEHGLRDAFPDRARTALHLAELLLDSIRARAGRAPDAAPGGDPRRRACLAAAAPFALLREHAPRAPGRPAIRSAPPAGARCAARGDRRPRGVRQRLRRGAGGMARPTVAGQPVGGRPGLPHVLRGRLANAAAGAFVATRARDGRGSVTRAGGRATAVGR